MNKIVETILDRIADWPEEAQAELIQSMVDIEKKHLGVYRLSDDERAAVREGLAQAERGEFVPDDVVAAYFKKHRA
jgi:predicted transcriptional regulator